MLLPARQAHTLPNSYSETSAVVAVVIVVDRQVQTTIGSRVVRERATDEKRLSLSFSGTDVINAPTPALGTGRLFTTEPNPEDRPPSGPNEPARWTTNM